MMTDSYIIGVDEVGRGSLAGPVVVAALRMPRKFKFPKELGKLRDSKRLTARGREKWFTYFTTHPEIEYALGRVYPRMIERMNITSAANLAAVRAVRRLESDGKAARIFLDGGLYLGSRTAQPRRAKTVIRGDETIAAVAAASIVAKVLRDRMLVRLAKLYPQYGFDVHKGYGTKSHFAAVRKYGPSAAHRLTFIQSYSRLKSNNLWVAYR